jgi:SAM-dependent methyltransferase
VTIQKYRGIVAHYESCLERYGDSHLGVDWPKAEDAATRYRVMLDAIRPSPAPRRVRLLDFGCGAGHLLDYIVGRNRDDIDYSGLDLSAKFVDLARRKFPSYVFYCGDILENKDLIPDFDYIVMNGVFTEKRDLSYDEMLNYFKHLVSAVWEKAHRGIAFNVMSKQVDWERNDLFHLPFDTLAAFLAASVSRNFVFRNDYGLYEYTTYVYR